MVSTNNLKNGMTLRLDDKLWQIVEWNHHKPGKGGAMVRTKLRSLGAGKIVEKTFRAGEEVEQAFVERKTLQFLYRDGDAYVLMDTTTYDQRHVQPEVIGDNAKWIHESDEIQVQEFEGEIIGVEVASSVELEVTQTDPGLAGDTATSASKPATLSTGVEVQVPLFVNIGDTVKVDTRSGEYLSRA